MIYFNSFLVFLLTIYHFHLRLSTTLAGLFICLSKNELVNELIGELITGLTGGF